MKVAIVGGSPSSEHLAPFNDESWEIWVHGNQMNRHEKRRVSKIFEIHENLSEHPANYPQWLADKNITMVVGESFPIKGEHIEAYPYDKANALLDKKLTSTPAYMMAYAILNGATEISIYGVDMAVDDHEYFHQRPAMYAWIAYAQAKGIKVYIPPESSLYKDPYIEGKHWGVINDGLKPFTEANFLAVAEMHSARIQEAEQQIQMLQAKIHAHNGSKQAYERLAKIARGVESGQTITSLTDSIKLR